MMRIIPTFPENDDDYDNSSTLLRDGTPGSSLRRLEPTRPPRRSPRTRSASSGDDHLFHMLDFADLLDGVDVTDKRPSDARFRNPERTTTPKDFFFLGLGFGFCLRFARLGAKPNRETEPSRLTSPHRATTTFPPPHPPLTPFLSSRRRNAARLTRRRVGGDDACRRSTATFRNPRARRSSIPSRGRVRCPRRHGRRRARIRPRGRRTRRARGRAWMRGRVRAQGGTRGSPRMRRSRRQSPVTRAGEGRGGGARGVGTRRARGYSAVDGHRRDAREGRDAATAAAASAAAAARRDAFDADAGAAASSRSVVAKGSAGVVFTTSVPRRVGSGSGVSGVSGVFSDDETARAREGERILVAGRFDDLAGELGELRGGRAVGGGASKGGKRGKSRR